MFWQPTANQSQEECLTTANHALVHAGSSFPPTKLVLSFKLKITEVLQLQHYRKTANWVLNLPWYVIVGSAVKQVLLWGRSQGRSKEEGLARWACSNFQAKSTVFSKPPSAPLSYSTFCWFSNHTQTFLKPIIQVTQKIIYNINIYELNSIEI